MDNFRFLTLFLVLLVMASSCTTSKFDFDTAYKFNHHRYQEASKAPSVVEPIASIQPVLSAEPHLPSDWKIKERHVKEIAANFQQHYQKASKQEKKAMRKEIKQEFKKVRQDVKVAKKEYQQKDVYFNKKMYIGLVVLLAGIVVAILASGAVGALAIIIGVGLIAWGFIEQA